LRRRRVEMMMMIGNNDDFEGSWFEMNMVQNEDDLE
jgi:hypothetical protein